jgi:hypothetical protein
MNQALKQARQEVRAGGDRQTVFNKYREQFPKPIKLATIVASTPQEPIPTLGRVLNAVLLVFLILAAISKVFAAIAMFGGGGSVLPVLLGIVLGLAIPVIFAIAVAKWEGQVYPILPILCLLGILRSWMKSPPLDAAIDTIFLVAIAGLAIAVKLIVFPHIGFLGVKKNAAGDFVF